MRQGTFSTLFNQLPNNRPNRILVLSNISVLLYLRGLYSSDGGDFIPHSIYLLMNLLIAQHP